MRVHKRAHTPSVMVCLPLFNYFHSIYCHLTLSMDVKFVTSPYTVSSMRARTLFCPMWNSQHLKQHVVHTGTHYKYVRKRYQVLVMHQEQGETLADFISYNPYGRHSRWARRARCLIAAVCPVLGSLPFLRHTPASGIRGLCYTTRRPTYKCSESTKILGMHHLPSRSLKT